MTTEELRAIKELYEDKTEMVNIAGKVPAKVLLFRRHTHDFESELETAYLKELADTLQAGMTVYDIGAENGEFTVMAANIVGGNNVHIFEPNADYFTNIKKIWEANNLPQPANCFNGYVYETSSEKVEYGTLDSLSSGEIFYGCLHINQTDTPMQTVSIDDYCKLFLAPDVVMMDIEGGELAAIRGAINILKKHKPIFFISIHKEYFIRRISNGTKEDLLKIFEDNGYAAKHISTDHEEHWKFFNL